MGKNSSMAVEWDKRSALTVVMAADGYPLNPRKGDLIGAIPKDSLDTKVFHAGTEYINEQITTQGGRVLGVTALGESLTLAHEHAYKTTQKIHWPGCFYRTDIGHRALAHITKKRL